MYGERGGGVDMSDFDNFFLSERGEFFQVLTVAHQYNTAIKI